VSAAAAAQAFEKAEQTLAQAAERRQSGLSQLLEWDGNALLELLGEIEAEFKLMVVTQSGHSAD
jgi:hypothetical protein